MTLFFYGVLLQSVARWPFLLGLGAGRAAMARGALYAVEDPAGCYPALIAGDGLVHGTVHALGSADLAAIDRFEGFDAAAPEASDYLRLPLEVHLAAGGNTMAETYVWNRPVAGLARIPCGDFRDWLARTGNTPYRAGR